MPASRIRAAVLGAFPLVLLIAVVAGVAATAISLCARQGAMTWR